MKIIRIDDKNGNLLNNLNKKHNGTLLFYHPQCHHCQVMKPQWELAKQELMRKKKDCNLYEVNGEHMHSINHPLKNVVSGFPTILNVNNGKIHHFNKERNMTNMIHFILSNLKDKSKNTLNSKKYVKKKKVSFKLNNDENMLGTRKVLNRKNIINSFKLNKRKTQKRKPTRKQNPKKKRKVQKKKTIKNKS